MEKDNSGNLSLKINGKADASTSGDMDPQLLSGHLPMLLHENPEDVLVIGLGSGITLGAVEQHEELKRVDAVEIEPAVVEAAYYFSEYSNNALLDPRLNLVVNDARNYVLKTDKKYDVITAEPSNPWMSGNSNLFTKEQFELYKKRLKPGGIVFQWAHIYKLRLENVKTIIATFQEVFPHTAVWQGFNGRDLFLIGTEESLKINLGMLEEKMEKEEVKKDLTRVHLDDPAMILSYSILNEDGARDFSRGAKIHSDNHPILEFDAPKRIYFEDDAISTRKALEDHRIDIFSLLYDVEDKILRKKISDYALSRVHMMKGEIIFYSGDFTEKAIAEYEKAAALVPDNDFNIRSHIAKLLRPLAKLYLEKGDEAGAINSYERILEFEPDDINLRLELGVLYGKAGLLDKAEKEFLRALERDRENFIAHNNLGNVYYLKGLFDQAILEYSKSLEVNPDQENLEQLIMRLKK